MSELGELRSITWPGEKWPDKRVSIANDDGALFVNARYLDNPEEKASHIVKCVNCYDELLEALKLAKLGLEAMIEDERCGETFVASVLTVDKLNHAIAKATGEQQ